MNTMEPRMGSDGSGFSASSSAQSESLGPLLRAVGRHYLLVLLVVGLTVGIAAGTVMQVDPTYEASTAVLVKPLPESDASFVGIGTIVDSADATRTIQTAAVLVSTPSAAQAAAKRMGPGWTRERVQDAVNVTPRGESYVLAITAKASSAPEAARLANTYTAAALAERGQIVQRNVQANIRTLRDRLFKLKAGGADAGEIADLNSRFEQLRALEALGSDPSLQLSQRAEPPSGSIGTSPLLVLILALISGLILGSIAALALEFFTRRIRDEEEIARLYPIPILAGIPKIGGVLKRRGVNPQALPPAVFEQVRLLLVQLPPREIPTSLLITSANSGDGKTTTAVALATAVAMSDEDVILIDLDLRKPGQTSVFDIPRPMYAAPSGARLELDDMLEPVLGLPRLRVMPAPLDGAMNLEPFVRQLPDLLAQAKRTASCVIIDAAPVGEVSDSLRIAAACDHVVFVVRPRHTDRRRFILTRDILARAGISPVGIVVMGQAVGGSAQRYDAYRPANVEPLAEEQIGARRERAQGVPGRLDG